MKTELEIDLISRLLRLFHSSVVVHFPEIKFDYLQKNVGQIKAIFGPFYKPG